MVASININKEKDDMDKIIQMLLAKVKSGSIKLQESVEGKSDDEITAMIKEALDVDAKEAISAKVLEQIKNLPTIEAIKAAIEDMLKKEKKMVGKEGRKKKEEPKEEPTEEPAEEPAEEPKEEAPAETPVEEPKDDNVQESVKKLSDEVKRLKSEKVLEEMLAKESILNDASKNRIRKYFDGKVFTKDEVNTEIVGLKKYLESMTGEKELKIAESSYVKVESTPKDRLTKLLEIFVNQNQEGTEGYEDITHNMLFRD